MGDAEIAAARAAYGGLAAGRDGRGCGGGPAGRIAGEILGFVSSSEKGCYLP